MGCGHGCGYFSIFLSYHHAIDITLDIPTGLEDPAGKSDRVYPNGAKDKLNFEIDESFHIIIFNISGVCEFEKPGVCGMYQMDVKDYPAGIYLANTVTHEPKAM